MLEKGGKSCAHCARRIPQGIGVPDPQWLSGMLGEEAPVGPHSFLSSCFSYGWFNTALMLEGRSYLPWLTNR